MSFYLPGADHLVVIVHGDDEMLPVQGEGIDPCFADDLSDRCSVRFPGIPEKKILFHLKARQESSSSVRMVPAFCASALPRILRITWPTNHPIRVDLPAL